MAVDLSVAVEPVGLFIVSISLKTHKILWARSGGKCAICKNDLVIGPVDPDDDPSIVGDQAHIIARSESFTRGAHEVLSPQERDHYSNLILLCKTHHKQVDDQPSEYTVEKLRAIKNEHEAQVRAQWTEEDTKKQQDDLIYAGYVDEWARRAYLDEWLGISSCLSTYSPTFPRDWYMAQKELMVWVLGRIWPGRYRELEAAIQNYTAVLQDLLITFDRHIDHDDDDERFIRTERFYKTREYSQKKYDQLLELYEKHENLVNDLFFELTRAANYVCDRARESIFAGYRLSEGALLVLRHSVGFKLETIHLKLEYRGDERTTLPYQGLKNFKQIRYTSRDYALDPGPMKPPELEGEDI